MLCTAAKTVIIYLINGNNAYAQRMHFLDMPAAGTPAGSFWVLSGMMITLAE